jgi:hypothetical protein
MAGREKVQDVPPLPGRAYVFGYASLVALAEPAAVAGRLLGFRRRWGAAMDNWDVVNDPKHFVDSKTGERPHIRVAYLDIEPSEGSTVNGLAIPVDGARLAALDAREVNYERVDVTDAFEATPGLAIDAAAGQVFTYVGAPAARERCRRGLADGNCIVARDYFAGVRAAFAALGENALAEFNRTTDELPFPLADLVGVNAPRGY